MLNNIKQNAVIITILALAISFVLLLILGMVFASVPMIISSFICGFVGYAISDYESQVTYNEDQV